MCCFPLGGKEVFLKSVAPACAMCTGELGYLPLFYGSTWSISQLPYASQENITFCESLQLLSCTPARALSLLALFYCPGACCLLLWLTPSSCQQGKIPKTLLTSTCKLLNEQLLQGALLMTTTSSLAAGLESAQEKGLVKNSIHHS